MVEAPLKQAACLHTYTAVHYGLNLLLQRLHSGCRVFCCVHSGPRPGVPLANGPVPLGGPQSGPQPSQQQATAMPGFMGPGPRPPGSFISGPPSAGLTTVSGAGTVAGGVVRPAMPGFISGPPGMARPVGPSSMGPPAGETVETAVAWAAAVLRASAGCAAACCQSLCLQRLYRKGTGTASHLALAVWVASC